MSNAACRLLPRETLDRTLLNSNPLKRDIEAARKTCSTCPVQKSCLVEAIVTEEGIDGRAGTFIWGGMNLRERMRFYKAKLVEGTWKQYVEEAATEYTKDPDAY